MHRLLAVVVIGCAGCFVPMNGPQPRSQRARLDYERRDVPAAVANYNAALTEDIPPTHPMWLAIEHELAEVIAALAEERLRRLAASNQVALLSVTVEQVRRLATVYRVKQPAAVEGSIARVVSELLGELERSPTITPYEGLFAKAVVTLAGDDEQRRRAEAIALRSASALRDRAKRTPAAQPAMRLLYLQLARWIGLYPARPPLVIDDDERTAMGLTTLTEALDAPIVSIGASCVESVGAFAQPGVVDPAQAYVLELELTGCAGNQGKSTAEESDTELVEEVYYVNERGPATRSCHQTAGKVVSRACGPGGGRACKAAAVQPQTSSRQVCETTYTTVRRARRRWVARPTTKLVVVEAYTFALAGKFTARWEGGEMETPVLGEGRAELKADHASNRVFTAEEHAKAHDLARARGEESFQLELLRARRAAATERLRPALEAAMAGGDDALRGEFAARMVLVSGESGRGQWLADRLAISASDLGGLLGVESAATRETINDVTLPEPASPQRERWRGLSMVWDARWRSATGLLLVPVLEVSALAKSYPAQSTLLATGLRVTARTGPWWAGYTTFSLEVNHSDIAGDLNGYAVGGAWIVGGGSAGNAAPALELGVHYEVLWNGLSRRKSPLYRNAALDARLHYPVSGWLSAEAGLRANTIKLTEVSAVESPDDVAHATPVYLGATVFLPGRIFARATAGYYLSEGPLAELNVGRLF